MFDVGYGFRRYQISISTIPWNECWILCTIILCQDSKAPRFLIFLNDTFLEKLDGGKCHWVYSMCSVEFHQKEKVMCRKLGTIRKNFVENILWNSIKKKKFGVEN